MQMGIIWSSLGCDVLKPGICALSATLFRAEKLIEGDVKRVPLLTTPSSRERERNLRQRLTRVPHG